MENDDTIKPRLLGKGRTSGLVLTEVEGNKSPSQNIDVSLHVILLMGGKMS